MWSEQKKKWFSDQVTRYRDSLYSVAISILKNDADAQDAIQEAVLLAYQNLGSLRRAEAFKPWLLQILTRTCYRMAGRRLDYVDIELLEQQLAQPQRDVDQKMTLWDAVQRLSLGYRTVVVLYYYEQLSVKEIATILSLSEDAVKKRLSRARKELKAMLTEEVSV
ncbi:MAG: RNA polymerase sigma factor [Candidatus Onthomonas sp.]